MSTKHLFATLATLAMLVVPAHSLTLINNDEAAYEVDIIVGEGDAATDQVVLAGGETKTDFCEDGCTIRLNNGAEQKFEGHETITIEDGQFAVSQ